MYAISFVGSIRRVDDLLDRALSLHSYRRERPALAVADEAASVLDDLGELTSVALPNAGVDGHARTAGDEAVETILTSRYEGVEGALDEGAVEAALDAGRVERIDGDGTILVPLGGEMPAIRNWWVLVGLALEWLDDLHDGFVRTRRRASVDGSAAVETAYWTVADRLGALREVLARARTVGRYVDRALQRGRSELITATADFVAAIAEGSDA